MKLNTVVLSIILAVTSLTAQPINSKLANIKHHSHGQPMSVGDAVPGSCIAPAKCSATINIPFDSAGTPDQTYWGNDAAYDLPLTFSNVPSGMRVRVLRLYGDHIAWLHAAGTPMPANSHAGVLWGIWSNTADSPNFPWSASFCFVYHQGSVSSGDFTQYFDHDVSVGGLLGTDNTMVVQLAVFLNDTGVSVHQELTMDVDYTFEPASGLVTQ